MVERYSINGKLVASVGMGPLLSQYLLEAAAAMEAVTNCYCYIVGTNKEEPDAVYVYEVWENQAAHRASLELPIFKALIAKAKPLIVAMSNEPALTIIGGKAHF